MKIPDNIADGFGETLKRWYQLNSWSIQTSHDWADAAGSAGPWNSQMSYALRNLLDPKPGFFLAIAAFNAAVAAQALPPTLKRIRRDQMLNAQPLTHDNGEIFTAADFFNLYVGAISCPEWLLAAQLPTPGPTKKLQRLAGDLTSLSASDRAALIALLSA